MKRKSKIFLISSSTGGHALPIFYIHEELKKDFYLKVLHSGSLIERETFRECKKVKIIAGKIKRYNYVSSFFEIIKSAIGFLQSFIILLFDRPRLIVSKGGFCAVPVLTAAKLLGIPFFAHESDSVMGVTNRIFALSAKKMFVGFPTSFYDKLIQSNLIYSGQIVKIEKSKDRTEAPMVYITGGSQGARSINDVVLKVVPKLLEKYQISHQTGEQDYEKVNKFRDCLEEKQKINYHVFSFSIEKSKESMAKAELIISRAGATTIGEIAALSKASILIPYKYATADHQTVNAKFLEKSGGAIVIKEENFDGKALLDRIEYLLSDKMNTKIVGEKANKVIKSDGLAVICDYIRKEIS